MPALDCVSNFWNYCPHLFCLTASSTRCLALFDVLFYSHREPRPVGRWTRLSFSRLILLPSRGSRGSLQELLPVVLSSHAAVRLRPGRAALTGWTFTPCMVSAASLPVPGNVSSSLFAVPFSLASPHGSEERVSRHRDLPRFLS